MISGVCAAAPRRTSHRGLEESKTIRVLNVLVGSCTFRELGDNGSQFVGKLGIARFREQGAKNLGPGPERGRAFRSEHLPTNTRAPCERASSQNFSEGGALPNSGLSGQHNHSTATSLGALEISDQLGQGRIPAIEEIRSGPPADVGCDEAASPAARNESPGISPRQ